MVKSHTRKNLFAPPLQNLLTPVNSGAGLSVEETIIENLPPPIADHMANMMAAIAKLTLRINVITATPVPPPPLLPLPN
ncbi:unnamed protein product [Gordionus sp. m RMFG-2023]